MTPAPELIADGSTAAGTLACIECVQLAGVPPEYAVAIGVLLPALLRLGWDIWRGRSSLNDDDKDDDDE